MNVNDQTRALWWGRTPSPSTVERTEVAEDWMTIKMIRIRVKLSEIRIDVFNNVIKSNRQYLDLLIF